MSSKVEEWNKSYERFENHIYYPKEEVVKFINRYIKKKTGTNKLKNVCDGLDIKGLDFGCGIGINTILMHEFGIDGKGIDLSNIAIKEAIVLSKKYNMRGEEIFSVFDGERTSFDNQYFDFSICVDVLDSMYFEIAKKVMMELNRVTKKYIFITLICGDCSEHYKEYNGEYEVQTIHENGTIQSFYNTWKIDELIQYTDFKIIYNHLHTEESLMDNYKNSRYYIVLERNN
jgi:SAM-dependent methyltransferase